MPPQLPPNPTPAQKPTILVKKADGTMVRVSLDELNRMKGSRNPSSSELRRAGKESQPVQVPARPVEPPKPQPKAGPPVAENLPATTAPVKDIFIDEAMAGQESKEIQAFRSKLDTLSRTPPRATPPPTPGKPMMHDIQPSPMRTKATMGPEEEIRAFGIVDFRRLSARPEEAAAKLIAKFQGWKDESYLLYMETVGAWRENPLYHAYQDVALQALGSKRTIPDILGGSGAKDQLTPEEFTELVKINKQLEI